jgi:hypothetical protein
MPILESASEEDLKRLLELFPVATLRERWPEIRGTKEELCFAVARRRDPPQLAVFVDQFFSCCKQHVYVFEPTSQQESRPVVNVPDGQMILEVRDETSRPRQLFLVRSKYTVILKEPLEEATLEFLWPVRIEFTAAGTVVVRFVVLEKNIGSYFDGRSYYVAGRTVDEEAILGALATAFDGITAIRKYHSSNNNNAVFDSVLKELSDKADASTKRLERTRLNKNIAAIEAYCRIYQKRLFKVLPNHRLVCQIGTIFVTAQPDLWVEENGVQVLLKIGASKKKPAYINVLLILMRKSSDSQRLSSPSEECGVLERVHRRGNDLYERAVTIQPSHQGQGGRDRPSMAVPEIEIDVPVGCTGHPRSLNVTVDK